jgi:DNA-binding MarR family transcriptional regulator
MSKRDAGTAPAFIEAVGAEKLVHEPARLVVLTALSSCASADFVFLQRLTGLQSGNLSQHLVKLEQAGYITLTKGFSGKYPQTIAEITQAGAHAIEDHWKRLNDLKKAASRFSGPKRR